MTPLPTQRSIAFVMDPLDGIDIQADTTFVLMIEAQRRGHEVLVVDPADLAVSDGRATARARPVQLRREVGRHAELGPEAERVLDAEYHVDRLLTSTR